MSELTQFPKKYIWKISSFSKEQSHAKSGEKTSKCNPPFYYFGCIFRLQLFPNGIDRGKDYHLSLYFHFLKGEYHAKLPWPFQRIVKFTLIDQQEDAIDRENIVQSLTTIPKNMKTVQMPLTFENTGRSSAEFVSLTKLTERRYISSVAFAIQLS